MSRVDKARAVKKRSKRMNLIIITIGFSLVLIVGLVYSFFPDSLSYGSGQNDVELIDMEDSIAFIDIFGLTYIHIYLKEGAEATAVSADGEALSYNSDRERWEGMLRSYQAGDELTLVVNAGDDMKQKGLLIISN